MIRDFIVGSIVEKLLIWQPAAASIGYNQYDYVGFMLS